MALRARALAAAAVTLVLVACSSGARTASEAAAPTGATAQPTSGVPTASSQSSATEAPSASSAPAHTGRRAWTELAVSGPTAREDHTWTSDGAGTAFLFGGRDGATVHGDLWAFDFATNAWEELGAPGGPEARFGHEAAWVEGIGLVVFGGQTGPTFFNDLWAFSPETGAWRELPADGAVPTARYGTCSGIGPDGRLWISHGFTEDQTRFADTVAYDFETGSWTDETPDAPLPVNRCLHGCWWTDADEFALYGGQTTGVAALPDLWLLSDGSWSRVEGEMPADRNLFAHVRLPGSTLVFGGQGVDRAYLADLYEFRDGQPVPEAIDLVGGPSARAGAAMVVDLARGRALLFGGLDGDGAMSDLWALEGIGPEG